MPSSNVTRKGSGSAEVLRRSDSPGRFGAFGGAYVPELLVPALDQLEQAFQEALLDPAFTGELGSLLRSYAGRPKIGRAHV